MGLPEKTANGYRIIQGKFIDGDWVQVDGWIVLCDLRSDGEDHYHPYVVWWMRDSDHMTVNGTYCKTYEEALINWEARS